MFPADLSLWIPKPERSSPILQVRIEVQASIQKYIFSSGQLSSMCYGLFVYPFWGLLPQYGSQTPVPLYFSLEAKCVPSPGGTKPSVALDHSSSGVSSLPGYFVLRCWPLEKLSMIQILCLGFLMLRMKQAVAKRYGIVAEFILSV